MPRVITVDFSGLSNKYYRTLRWRARHRKRWLQHLRNSMLKRLYGITSNEYEHLLIKQKGFCSICRGRQKNRQNRRLDVDHERGTKKVRGLLCNHCNRGLAFFLHDTKLLSAAIDYMFASAEELTLK